MLRHFLNSLNIVPHTVELLNKGTVVLCGERLSSFSGTKNFFYDSVIENFYFHPLYWSFPCWKFIYMYPKAPLLGTSELGSLYKQLFWGVFFLIVAMICG